MIESRAPLRCSSGEEDVPVENSVLVKSVENAQQKVEGINFEIRKQLVDYDDVANTQRDVVYKMRDRIVDGGDFREEINGYIKIGAQQCNHRSLGRRCYRVGCARFPAGDTPLLPHCRNPHH